uniref:Uncharacterized protein n=1 Tax=Cacopsylla melanoneura TaxID=428564 RepID=A0A8D8LLT0_9HEMI
MKLGQWKPSHINQCISVDVTSSLGLSSSTSSWARAGSISSTGSSVISTGASSTVTSSLPSFIFLTIFFLFTIFLPFESTDVCSWTSVEVTSSGLSSTTFAISGMISSAGSSVISTGASSTVTSSLPSLIFLVIFFFLTIFLPLESTEVWVWISVDVTLFNNKFQP